MTEQRLANYLEARRTGAHDDSVPPTEPNASPCPLLDETGDDESTEANHGGTSAEAAQ